MRGPRLQAYLALQVNGGVAVGEVLPQQQCVLVLFPRQAVAVVVKVKGLTPTAKATGGTGND